MKIKVNIDGNEIELEISAKNQCNEDITNRLLIYLASMAFDAADSANRKGLVVISDDYRQIAYDFESYYKP